MHTVSATACGPHLVDATLFYTPTSGGVRRYLLTKHDWLGRHSRVRHTLFVPGPEDCGEAGGRVEFGSPHLRAGYRCPVRLASLRETLARLEPDLLEAGDPYLMAWQVVAVADRLGIPAVAFCHSDIINLAETRFGRTAGRVTSAYLRALYGHFDQVLAPSRIVADHLEAAGIRPVALQPLGVDAEVFSPDRRDPRLRERLGLTASTRLLCFAGRLAPEKNLPDLMKMADILGEPYHLLIVGGEEAMRLNPRVSVLPYEPEQRAVAAILGACDAFVHAGRQETFGLVAVEAMACGLPVVAYPAGALEELVDPEVGALARTTTPAALAEAVHHLFDQDRAMLASATRRRVLERHSWDAAFGQLLRTYATLLSPSAQPVEELALSGAV
jgi:alpha-1,6-mannosyltransferase